VAKGIYAKHNLDIELYPFTSNGQTVIQALATSKADAGAGLIGDWLKPLEQGFDVKLFVGSHGGCGRLFASDKSGVKTLGDLKGKTIATFVMGASPQTVLQVSIAKAGVDPNADVMMVRGAKWATGDGLIMAREAGAGVSGMAGVASLHIAAVSPKEPAAGQPGNGVPYFLGINRDGKRYVDESRGYVAHGKAALKQPGQTVALIFDSEIAKIQEGPAIAIAAFKNVNQPIIEADTLEELAAKIQVPPAQLVATVKAFNDAVKDGKALGADPPKATLAYRVQTPKFYAFYPLVPGITLTFGGLMINDNAQVLEPDGRIIPGLYAAGENAGAVYYDDYIGGGSLTNCLVMGRIAGGQAVKVKTPT